MALWRCSNEYCSTDPHGRLIFDFEATDPVCPKCGTDGRKTLHMIVRRKVMHFDAPHPKIARRGMGHAACDASKRVTGTEFVAFTGDPHEVNCPKCRATAEWAKATEDNPEPIVYAPTDFPVTVDPKEKTIVKAG